MWGFGWIETHQFAFFWDGHTNAPEENRRLGITSRDTSGYCLHHTFLEGVRNTHLDLMMLVIHIAVHQLPTRNF